MSRSALLRRATVALVLVLATSVIAALLPATPVSAAKESAAAKPAPDSRKPMAKPATATEHVDPPGPDPKPAGPHAAPLAEDSRMEPGPDPSTLLPSPAGPKPGEEIVERRSKSTKTFATDKAGVFETKAYSKEVHRKDSKGDWVDIDTNLASEGNGRFRSVSTSTPLSVATSNTDAALGRLELDSSHEIEFGLAEALPGTAEPSGTSVTYRGIRPFTDLTLTTRDGGFKEDIVLNSPAAPDTFVFPLALKKLTASVDGETGDVVYRDEKGEVRARTPHGYMADSTDRAHGDGVLSLGVVYEVVSDGSGGQALKVTLDRAWLDDPARVYPVTVDPDYWNSTTFEDDTYVMSNFTRDNAYDGELKVGTYDGGSHIGISFMNFNMSALNGKVIDSAVFNAREAWSWSCSPRGVGVYRVTQAWGGHSMTGYPGASLGERVAWNSFAMGFSGSCPAGWFSENIQPTVHNWTHGTPQFGLAMKVDPGSETDNYAWKKFDSWDACGGGGCIPRIDIYWHEPNSAPSVPSSITPANGANFTSSAPTQATATYSDPDGNAGRVYFRLRNSSGGVVTEGYSGQVASGQTAAYGFPNLDNGTYTLDAFATDNVLTSAWSAAQTFTVGVRAQVSKSLTNPPAGGQFSLGQVATYDVTVTNPMPVAMPITSVTDVLPVGFAAAGNGCSAPSGLSCAVSGRTMTVPAFTLAANESKTFTVRAVAVGDATNCSTWNNAASAVNSAGTATSSPVPLTICDARLGIEGWWSYVSRPTGPDGMARVNVSNGNLVLTQTDSTPVQAHGSLAYVVRRAYNSADSTAIALPGNWGKGWTLNVGSAEAAGSEGVTAAGLYVPSLESLSQPLAVTLVDRDGTRHHFTPRALTAALDVTSVNAALHPTSLAEGLTGSICVDQAYTAPAGVHLGLWRYVKVTATGAGACSAANIAASGSVVVGYAAVRPDRLRTEFAATGQLVDMLDGAGNDLRYVYENQPAPGVALGNLTAVYEPRSCTPTASPVTAASIPSSCRASRFAYTATVTTITDPAGRETTYTYDSERHLTRVTNPDGSTLDYAYGGCNGTADQLCSASDPRGGETTLAYKSASSQNQPSGSQPVIGTLTDRRNNPIDFDYTAGTKVDQGGHRTRFVGIDSAGRVGEINESNYSDIATRRTLYTWDTVSATCRVPNAAVDNNLCGMTRKALGGASTPDEVTTYTYTDEGAVAIQHQMVTATTSVDTTYGYHVQYVDGAGTTSCRDHTPTGAGVVSQAATACTASAGLGTLYAISDKTAMLSPRGNAVGAVVATYKTTYTVDNTVGGANMVKTGFCGTSPAANSGLLCETDQPVYDGTNRTLTRYSYDGFGQKATMTTPLAIATGSPATYSYTYYADGDLDLSANVSAGGWLKAVTDPAGKFVAFAYDRAGNTVRTWDRNATAGHTVSETWGNSSAPASTYAETLYATGATPYATPWKWVRSARDPLGNTTVFTVDANGNQTAIRSPRGNTTSQSFDADDNLTSRTLPMGDTAGTAAGTTTFAYDAFGNPVRVTDPRGSKKVTAYDTSNRATTVRWSRTNDPAQAACTLVGSGDPDFPSGAYVCSTVTAYDGEDNVTGVQDANGQTATSSYDGLHRVTSKLVPRNANGITNLRSDTIYDADGHPTVECAPREFTEGSGSCTAASVYAATHTYDPLGRLTSTTRSRQAGSTYTVRFAYDADGNQIKASDANAATPFDVNHTTVTAFDLLDRRLTQDVPRSAGVTVRTSWTYDAVGNVLSVTSPPSGNGEARITAYSYDKVNRPIDTVVGSLSTNASAAGLPSPAGSGNTRTRVSYDADGNVTANYGPRAFLAYGTHLTNDDVLANPNPAYMVRTVFDANGRPVEQAVPRYDGTVAATGGSTTQSDQCATGVSGYAATTGVCITRLRYDEAGNRIRVDLPTIAGSGNRYVTVGYTDDNLVAQVSSPSPETDGSRVVSASYVYDGSGRVRQVTDALGQVTTTSYTADRLVDTVTEPAGVSATHVTAHRYDANGNPVSETDAVNNTSTRVYFADNLVKDVVDGGGNTTRYAYDNAGNPTSVWSPSAVAQDPTNPAGTPTGNTFTFDNLLLTTTTPVSGATTRTVTFGYDPAGRKISQQTTLANPPVGTPSDGGIQRFNYFANDRVSSEFARVGANTSVSGSISYSYDPDGKTTSISHSAYGVAALNATYFNDGLVRSVDDGTRTVSYSYDGAGRIASRVDAANPATTVGRVTTYSYGDAGLPAAGSSDVTGTGSWAWSYDKDGRPTRTAAPNGQVVTGCWNDDDTLAEQVLTSSSPSTAAGVCPVSGSSVLARWTYGYDGLRRVTSQGFTGVAASGGSLQTGTYSFTYDAAGRVASFNDGTVRNVSWDHDGNRTGYGADVSSCNTATPASSCTQYNADDTIKQAPDGGGTPRTYSYDPTGRIQDDGCTAFAYDGFDRMSSMTGHYSAVGPNAACPGGTASYTYDGADRQRSHTETSTTGQTTGATLAYDGLSSTVINESPTLGSTSLPITYTLDPSGAKTAYATLGTSVLAHFLADDGRGNIATVTSAGSSPSVECTARFDAFGSPQRPPVTGTDWDPAQHTCNTGTTQNDAFYQGARRDQATGTYQFGARTYDPTKAGFLTPDSYRAGPSAANLSVGVDPLTRNTYSYVNGDPVNFVDPNGHARIPGTNWCIGKCKKRPAKSKSQDAGSSGKRKNAAVAHEEALIAFMAYTSNGWVTPDKYTKHQSWSEDEQEVLYEALQFAQEHGCQSGHPCLGINAAMAGVTFDSEMRGYGSGQLRGIPGAVFAAVYQALPFLLIALPGSGALAAEGGEGLLAGGRATANPLGGTQNCVACALAGDARLAGNAAAALKTDAQLISVIEDMLGGSFRTVSGRSEVMAMLENAGPGARGIVFGDRGVGEVGHVWNAVNQGGTIRFIDFQSGRAASFSGYKGFEFLLTAGGG